MDVDRFTEGMNLLSATFDPDSISEQKVEDRYKAYLLVLGDLDGEAFWEGCRRAANTLRFFPKPVELRECLQALAAERARTGRAEEYAERVRLSDEALERERAAVLGVWDPVRRVLVKSDGSATGAPPLPEEGGVAAKVIDLAERLAAKGAGRPALPPPLSAEEFERLREALLVQAEAVTAAYEAKKGAG